MNDPPFLGFSLSQPTITLTLFQGARMTSLEALAENLAEVRTLVHDGARVVQSVHLVLRLVDLGG